MTAQIGDLLYYNGNQYYMASEPSIIGYAIKNLEIRFISGSTACWRGYRAEWEIIDSKLFLKKVIGNAEVTDLEKYREEKLRLRKLLKQGVITPTENGKLLREFKKNLMEVMHIDLKFLHNTLDPVFADWISGVVRVPREEILDYIHGDYCSVFEEDMFFKFSKGILMGTKIVKNGDSYNSVGTEN